MRFLLGVLLMCASVAAQTPKPEQLFREAVAAQQRGDLAAAVSRYQQLIRIQPDVLEVRANLGAALAGLGRFDEAIEQYRAALARDAGNFALRMNLALAYYKKQSFAEAARELEHARGSARNDLRAATLLADCYARLGEDDKVIAVLAPIASTYAKDPGLQFLLGSALVRAGRKGEGVDRLEKAGHLGNSAEAFLLAGQTLLKMDEFERARDDANAALRLNPRLAGAMTVRGMALQYIGDNPGAITVLNKALEADPEDFDAHLTLGAVLSIERDLTGARRHLERALELQPSSNLARYAMARLERAAGNTEDAIRDFEKVVKADPGWAQPRLELSVLYFQVNRPEDGEREKAVYERLSGK